MPAIHPRLAAALVVGAITCAVAVADEPPGDWPVLSTIDFDADDLEDWTFTDRGAWRVVPGGPSGPYLEQFRASRYEPPVRSPLNIALLPDLGVTDLDLRLRVRSTARDYDHRDLCLFFGYQDPSHFYYAHLGKRADPHAHSIFLVNGEPRVSIAEDRTDGTPWTDDWHTVRIVRRVEDGLIQVYYDDLEKPIMTAHDKTFTHGRIGVGSFDDTGQFDTIELRGRRRADEAKSKPGR
jgi:hypothetical protein